MKKKLKRITRTRLTKEEAAEYKRIRELIEKDLPDLIRQHHERMKKRGRK